MLCSAGAVLGVERPCVIEDGTDFVQDPRQSDNDPNKANDSDTPPYTDVDPVIMVSGDYVYQASDADISAGLQKISVVRSYNSDAFEPDEDTIISVLPIGSIIFLAITDDPNALEEAELWDLCDAESIPDTEPESMGIQSIGGRLTSFCLWRLPI